MVQGFFPLEDIPEAAGTVWAPYISKYEAEVWIINILSVEVET